ncbi:MAG: sugar phosphate isomerase/epimerase [Clostridiales bacterium]|nr:sugar phosphate isomerase/epimerase [Clostridiales bacterium]
MKKPMLGIQLFTLRDHIKTPEDFDSTLARLEAMGVSWVQISAIGDIPAPVQADILKKHNMQVCVTHKPFDRMENDLDALLEEHRVIGCDAVGLGCATKNFRYKTENVETFIDKVNSIGRKMKEQGFTFHYHNHDFEFDKLENSDKCMMDMLLTETDGDCVKFIPDIAWMHFAKQDPIEVMQRMNGRIKVIHFKDYIIDDAGERKFVTLGQGRVNLSECYRFACENEIPYIMYEHDCDWPDDDPFKACEISWKYLTEFEKS